MPANQLVQARIDGAVKEEATAVLAAMGLTVSDAVRLLLTRSVAFSHTLRLFHGTITATIVVVMVVLIYT